MRERQRERETQLLGHVWGGQDGHPATALSRGVVFYEVVDSTPRLAAAPPMLLMLLMLLVLLMLLMLLMLLRLSTASASATAHC